jgi:hypothetical protein
VDFYRRHIEAYTTLVTLSDNMADADSLDPNPFVPPPATLHAAHFIKGLCSSRYATYRAELYNQTKLRGAAFPATLEAAFREANSYVVVTQQNTTVQAGTYVTLDKSTAAKGKGKQKGKEKGKGKDNTKSDSASGSNKREPSKPCSLCRGPAPFHWTSDCPEKEFYEAALATARVEAAVKDKTEANTKVNSARTYVTLPTGPSEMSGISLYPSHGPHY